MKKWIIRTGRGAEIQVSKFGGQVLSWKTVDGEEQLFMSSAARFDEASAIRGGVPIVFPVFGRNPAFPSHGFARISHWQQEANEQEVDRASIKLSLALPEKYSRAYPSKFRLALIIEIEDFSLNIKFCLQNIDRQELKFQGGMHTYLKVNDIYDTQLLGLKQQTFAEDGFEHRQATPEIRITKATDRIYLVDPTIQNLVMLDGSRRMNISSTGFSNCVVWNPWAEGAKALDDMENHGYRSMLCVEAVNAVSQVIVAPNQTWVGSQRLQVMPLV